MTEKKQKPDPLILVLDSIVRPGFVWGFTGVDGFSVGTIPIKDAVSTISILVRVEAILVFVMLNQCGRIDPFKKKKERKEVEAIMCSLAPNVPLFFNDKHILRKDKNMERVVRKCLDQIEVFPIPKRKASGE